MNLLADLVAGDPNKGVGNAGGGLGNNILRELYGPLPVAIYATDADGHLTYFNDAAVKLAGRIPELGSDRWCVTLKIFRPDGTPLPHEQCPMAVLLKGGDLPAGLECVAERPDGSRFWFTPLPTVLRDAEGRITGGINILIDITDRKRAEIDANAQFKAMVEATPECVKIVSPEGKLLFMNAQGLEMVEAPSAAALVGGDVCDVIAPEDRDKFRAMNERVCSGEKGSLEFDIVGLRGTRRHMESHAVPLRHIDGTMVQLALTRDVTKRTQAEMDALLLAAIVDSSDDAIVSKDLNSTITSWNKSAERLFGYTAEEAIGKSVTMLIPPDRQEEEPQIIARLKRGERVDHIETKRVRKDGTLIDLSLTISPVKDASGRVIGASKIARDISERIAADLRRQRIEDELRRANEDLEQFAFSASHDLQEPLRSVKIYSELLSLDYGDAFTGEAQEYLRHLQNGASRMGMLVRDLLSYTQVTRYEKPAEPAKADDAFIAAVESLSHVMAENGARVTADALPALPVHPAHLQQLFQNLIGNAIKYRSRERAPVVYVTAAHVTVSHVKTGGSEEQWLFSVIDNGIGIEPEYREKIFGLFKRLHTNDEYSGTGLGLAICQRIVERYHGRIWVESEPGKGSTFRFTLPVG